MANITFVGLHLER